MIGDFLQCGDLDALTPLDHLHEAARLDQAVHGARIQPRKAASHDLRPKGAVLQIHIVQRSDLQFAPCAGFHLLRQFADPLVVEIQAGDAVVALGIFRLFLHGKHLAVGIELHDAEAFRIVDEIAEDRSKPIFRILRRFPQHSGKTVAIEDVIPQHHGAGLSADKILADQECLRQSIRGGLHRILERNAELASVPQQLLKAGRVRGSRDHQNILNSRQHQRRQRVIDHRFIIDRQKLLGSHHGQRIQPRSCAACQNNSFHRLCLLSIGVSIIHKR